MRSAPKANADLPVKGSTVPSGGPLSTLVDPIDLADAINPQIGPLLNSSNEHIVLHVHSGDANLSDYTGVYSPPTKSETMSGHRCGYRRNPRLTKEFLQEMGGKIQRLSDKGYSFQLSRNNTTHGLLMINSPSGGNYWCLCCEDGVQFVEGSTTPRARDKRLWHDPDTYKFLSAYDVHSVWLHYGANDRKPKRKSVLIAMTPLECAKKVLTNSTTLPRQIPIKYQKAPDFSRWDRNFVLHVDCLDLRACDLDVVKSVTGVYVPLRGEMIKCGYPVWKRQNRLTNALVNDMSDAERNHLEKLGIKLTLSGNRQQYIYVEDNLNNNREGSFLITSDSFGINDARKSTRFNFNRTCLLGSCIPNDIDTLLSDPTSLFTTPGRAFATWSLWYCGKWVQLYAAFTPEDYFREAINLASLEVDKVDMNDDKSPPSSSPKRKKKKKKKKKQAFDEGKDDKVVADESDTKLKASVDNDTKVKKDKAFSMLRHLAKLVSAEIPTAEEGKEANVLDMGVEETLQALFDMDECDQWCEDQDTLCSFAPPWASLDDSVTSSVLEAAISCSPKLADWFQEFTTELIILFTCLKVREKDLTVLLNAGVDVYAGDISNLFESLPAERGAQFNNKIAKVICSKCKIIFESRTDYSLVKDATFNKIGKGGKKEVAEALKKASSAFQKSKRQSTNMSTTVESKPKEEDAPANENQTDESDLNEKVNSEISKEGEPTKQSDLKKAGINIQEGLQWYLQKLDSLIDAASSKEKDAKEMMDEIEDQNNIGEVMSKDTSDNHYTTKPKNVLSSEQVVAALSCCKSEAALVDVETGIDLFQWDSMSEWTIDITEHGKRGYLFLCCVFCHMYFILISSCLK